MYNNIWDQRYVALEALLESLGMTEELANRIKNNFDSVEENVPERFVGYVDSLLKYIDQLSSLWSVLYNEDEYQQALDSERPKLILPPSVTTDANGTPQTTTQQLSMAVPEDSEGNTTVTDPARPGFSQESDINIGWFGNLVNILNNYVPEKTKDWAVIWKLIREGMGIANGVPSTYTKENLIGTGTTAATNFVPQALSGDRDAYKAEPIPEFVGRPDDTAQTIDKEPRQCVHEQVFPYGDHTVILKIYSTTEATMVEVKIGPMSTLSSIPAIEGIGQAVVPVDVSYFENVRIPLLVRKEECFAFSCVSLCLNNLVGFPSSCLGLSLVGLADPDTLVVDKTIELAANTTYTVVQPIAPDRIYTSSPELGDWQISAMQKGQLLTYSVEYLGGVTPPVPPEYEHILDAYNIGSAVFNEIRANRYVLSKEAIHNPTEEGTEPPITYENIGTGSYERINSRRFVLVKEDPHPPATLGNPDNPLRFDNISSAVLEQIKANRFVVTSDTTKPEGIVIVPEKAPNQYDYFAVNFTQFSVDFNVSFLIHQSMPAYLSPPMNLATFLFGNNQENYGGELQSKGDVDMLGYFSTEGTLPFMGLYAYNGDKTYNRIYNYDDRRITAACSDTDPVFEKIADRFTLRIYQADCILIYSFEATYGDKQLETWSDGTHKIVTEGEMPRNCMPQSHIICPIGKFSYLTYQSNGAVRLTTAQGEVIQQHIAFNCVGITEKKDLKKNTDNISPVTLPSRARRGKKVLQTQTYGLPRDAQYVYYEWPGVQLRNFTVNDDGGIKALEYVYDINNLRTPIVTSLGNEVRTNDDVARMIEGKTAIRLRTGDNVLLRILNITSEMVPNYQQYYTGRHTFLLYVCEYVWMRPQIKFVVNSIKETNGGLKKIMEDWDGIKKSEYFAELNAHRESIGATAEFSTNILKEFEKIQSAGSDTGVSIASASTM